MKHIFILNPAAGKSNAFEKVRSELERNFRDYDYELYQTKEACDTSEYVRQYCSIHPEPVRFYACGGDGTLNGVVNGAVGFPQASVGCYPCGSGNDFVKYYGGKEHFLDLRAQAEATEEEIDLMRVGDLYAINATHFGFDSFVAKAIIDVRRKKLIGGNHAYTTGVAIGLIKGMKNTCSVTVDGKLMNPSGKLLLCTIANGQYVGGSYRCAPRSFDNDGLLEVCMFRPVSRLTFFRLVKFYTKGTHLGNPKFEGIVQYCRGKKIDVEAPDGFVYSMDGEVITGNRFSVEIVPRAIRFAVPKGASAVTDDRYATAKSKKAEQPV